jgi:heme exporter protein C
VFAITAGAFVPLNFLAVRLAQAYTHPRVFATTGGGLPPRMQLAFYVMLVGMALLYATLWKYEMTSKSTSWQLRRLRAKLVGDESGAPRGRSAAPSLPTTT